MKRTKSQQKEKDARDKKVAEEQARQLEIKEAEDRKAAALAKEAAKEIEIRSEEKRKRIEAMRAKERIEEPLIYTDYETGLIWAKDGNISGEEMTWQKAQTWAATLNYAGYVNWRLPTLKEFLSFTKHGRKGLGTNGFNNVRVIEDRYWTATEVDYGSAPNVYIRENDNGGGGSPDKGFKNFAWPVHDAVTELERKAEAEQARLQIEQLRIENEKSQARLDQKMRESGLEIKDDMIIDKNSGLMWVIDINYVAPRDNTYAKLLKWADNFRYAGYSDWRIPTSQERTALSKYAPEIVSLATKKFQNRCNSGLRHRHCYDIGHGITKDCDWLVRGGDAPGWFSKAWERLGN